METNKNGNLYIPQDKPETKISNEQKPNNSNVEKKTKAKKSYLQKHKELSEKVKRYDKLYKNAKADLKALELEMKAKGADKEKALERILKGELKID